MILSYITEGIYHRECLCRDHTPHGDVKFGEAAHNSISPFQQVLRRHHQPGAGEEEPASCQLPPRHFSLLQSRMSHVLVGVGAPIRRPLDNEPRAAPSFFFDGMVPVHVLGLLAIAIAIAIATISIFLR